MAEGWDKEVDVLVVGSGAGGMLNAHIPCLIMSVGLKRVHTTRRGRV